MVARQSSPSNKPEILDVPSAKEDKMIDLCEIDLSPGTVISPFKLCPLFIKKSN